MLSQTFEPASLSQESYACEEGRGGISLHHMSEYHATLKKLQTGMYNTTEKLFSESLDDTTFPPETMQSLRTRDMLKQKWEESCALADQVGPEQRFVLSNLLDKFQQDCHDVMNRDTNIATTNDQGEKPKHVGMAGAKYTGAQKRVNITHGKFYT